MNSILARFLAWWWGAGPGLNFDRLDELFNDPELCDCEVCRLVQEQDEADEDWAEELETYGEPG